jgi:hypothetical protein
MKITVYVWQLLNYKKSKQKVCIKIHGLSHITTNLHVVCTPAQIEARIESPSLTPYATFGNQFMLLVTNEKLDVI